MKKINISSKISFIVSIITSIIFVLYFAYKGFVVYFVQKAMDDTFVGGSASDITIGALTTVPSVTMLGGAISNVVVTPLSLRASATGNVSLSLTVTNPLPLDGKIVFTFPSTFGIASNIIATSTSDIDGSLGVTINGNDVIMTRSQLKQTPTL